ncbi:MAG: proton-conducting transporter membrane subunit, partial [Chryseotalea sp.]
MTGLAEKIQLSELSLSFILPEIILAIGIVLLVFTILFKPSTRKPLAWTISFLAILLSIFLILSKLSSYSNPIYLFHRQLVQHAPALLFILVCDVAMLIGLLISLPYIQKDENVFLIVLLSILLGCHLLCLSANWLIFFISLELIAIPGYLLAAFKKEKKNFEASIKYFVFGSFISALMLYGISWLYGITGTFNFYDAAFNEQIQ